MKTRSVLTVSELTGRIKQTLEPEYSDLLVEGEISNLKVPASGHFYFTLKDNTSQVRAVMFRFRNKTLRYRPEDGMKVVCKCRINVYEPRGEYQLLVDTMTPRGIGDLQFAFEQLKRKLEAEGLFDGTKKKPIPFLPEKIAVITSPSGAAVKDIIQIIKRRFSNMPVLVVPVKVQGDLAAAEIEAALDLVNRRNLADIIILGRGGGAIEDLWAFNEERVARAVFASRIPVISAVGHETDVTITDFVADLRAPTPSAAAEIAVREKEKLQKQIRQAAGRLKNVLLQVVEKNRLKMNYCRNFLHDRAKLLSDLRLRNDDLSMRLCHTLDSRLRLKRTTVDGIRKRLLSAPLTNLINTKKSRLNLVLEKGSSRLVARKNARQARFQNCAAKLASLSPLHTLNRGFSITRHLPDSQTVKTAAKLSPGDMLNIRFAKGSADAKVIKVNG